MKQKACNKDVTHVTGEKACETNNCGGVGVGLSKEGKKHMSKMLLVQRRRGNPKEYGITKK